MILLFLSAIIIGLSSFYITSYLFRSNSLTDFFISWFTIFFAQIVFVTLILGIISKLFLANFILLQFLICLVSYCAFRKFNYLKRDLAIDISFITGNKLLLLAFSIFAAFFSVKTFLNLINPSVYADALQYHLTFPATWIKNANLNNPIVVFDRNNFNVLNALTYFPLNGEIFFFWLMLPLRNAFLADIGQAPFYIIGVLALYSILRKFDIKKETALFCGLLWALVPNILKQVEYGALVDVMCAVLFLVVLNNLLILRRDSNYRNAFLFGLSIGLFIGIKAINIFWLSALVPLFLYSAYSMSKKTGLRQLGFGLIFILLALLIFGSFSYLRNFILTGNTFYPIEVKLFGKVIMPGPIDKVTYSRFLVPWEEFKLKNMFFSEGLGLQFLAFIFPGSFIPLIFLAFLRKKAVNLAYYFFIFFIPAYMFVLYIFYLKAYWIRYFFPYLGAGFISSVIFLDKFNWGKRFTSLLGTICIFSSAGEMSGHLELIVSLLLSLLICLVLIRSAKISRIWVKKYFSVSLCAGYLLLIFIIFQGLNNWYERREFKRYPYMFSRKLQHERDAGLAWQWLNEYTDKGMRLAYTGRPEFYPLFGSNLKNDVFYISVNNKPSIPHYYPDGDYRKEQLFGSWLKNLKNAKIGLVFIYQMHDSSVFPIENNWALEHPEYFKLIFANSKVRIYSCLN